MTARARRRGSTFGTVRKLPSGRWQARYFEADGITRRNAPDTFDAKMDAEAWLATVRADKLRGTYAAPQAASTFADYSARWLEDRDLKPRTREHYADLLRRFILPVFGSSALNAITVDHVRRWYAKTGTGTPTTRAHAYSLLKTILGTAVADDLISSNPCRIRGASQAKTVVKIRPATLDELETLVAAMPARYRLLTLLAAWTGLRFGELAELRHRDVDGVSGVLRVRRGVTRAEGATVVGSPKSRAGIRDVTTPPHLLPMLREHMAGLAGPDALLFTSGTGAQLQSSTLYRSFYPARDEAGRPDLRWHDLRHTGAVLAASTGATLAELMARLGHSTPAAALRYQHAAHGRDAIIAGKLSELANLRDG